MRPSRISHPSKCALEMHLLVQAIWGRCLISPYISVPWPAVTSRNSQLQQSHLNDSDLLHPGSSDISTAGLDLFASVAPHLLHIRYPGLYLYSLLAVSWTIRPLLG